MKIPPKKVLGMIGILIIYLTFTFSAFGQTYFSPGSLTDVHAKVAKKCTFCHQPFKGTPDDRCLNCHNKITVQMKKREGLHGGLKAGYCSACHNEHSGLAELKGSFKFNDFNHDWTRFSLKDHKKQSCAVCHKGQYSFYNQVNCKNCHIAKVKQFRQHVSKFGDACLDCHDGISNKFKHAREKWFFKSKHLQAKCNDCHKNDSFLRLSTGCLSCHKPAHDAKIGQNCLTCHYIASWNNVRFRHSDKSTCSTCHDSPSNHFGTACQSCHKFGSWKSARIDHSAGSECYKCHQTPNGHFGQNCAACHSPSRSWDSANFDHPGIEEHSYTSFSCVNCHPNGYQSSSCIKCHDSGNPSDGDNGDDSGEGKDSDDDDDD